MTTAATALPLSFFSMDFSGFVEGMQPGTVYHVRAVLINSAGKTYGPDGTFKTYPLAGGGGVDPCPNALARKQTTAQRLPDCRAYELVSASDTGGYDVESYLAPGQNPFAGFPLAADRLLYATHSGAVPGPWNATNHGPDPYLATRSANGWTTDYEGLPAELEPGRRYLLLGPRRSRLLARTPSLSPARTSAAPASAGPRNRSTAATAERPAGPGHGGLARRQCPRRRQARRQSRQVLLRRTARSCSSPPNTPSSRAPTPTDRT